MWTCVPLTIEFRGANGGVLRWGNEIPGRILPRATSQQAEPTGTHGPTMIRTPKVGPLHALDMITNIFLS